MLLKYRNLLLLLSIALIAYTTIHTSQETSSTRFFAPSYITIIDEILEERKESLKASLDGLIYDLSTQEIINLLKDRHQDYVNQMYPLTSSNHQESISISYAQDRSSLSFQWRRWNILLPKQSSWTFSERYTGQNIHHLMVQQAIPYDDNQIAQCLKNNLDHIYPLNNKAYAIRIQYGIQFISFQKKDNEVLNYINFFYSWPDLSKIMKANVASLQPKA